MMEIIYKYLNKKNKIKNINVMNVDVRFKICQIWKDIQNNFMKSVFYIIAKLIIAVLFYIKKYLK